MITTFAHGLHRRTFIAGLLPAAAGILHGCGGGSDSQYAISPDAKVTVEGGEIQGSPLASGVQAFLGVPYMASPAGELRWRAPQPTPRWTGTASAQSFPPVARYGPPTSATLTGTSITLPATEDGARYLNMWVPPAAKASRGQLPVLVWIHGNNGNASEYRYAGDRLAERGLIVVNPQHRQGVFATLALAGLSAEPENHGSSGNFDVLDLIAALQWVRANIDRFGGDPGNVTLGGHSMGSTYVTLLQTSPLAKGLFQRVWTQAGFWFNGTGPDSGPSLATAQATGAAWMGQFGAVAGTTTAASVADLRAKSADEIVKVVAIGNGAFAIPGALAGPPQGYIDGYVYTDTATNTFRAGRQIDVPSYAEWSRDEGGYPSVLSPIYSAVALPVAPATSLSTYKSLLDRYFGANAATVFGFYPAYNDADAMAQAQRLTTEITNERNNVTYARLQRMRGTSPVYLARFDRGTPNTVASSPPLLAKHGWENPYWRGRLDALYIGGIRPNTTVQDYELSDRMMDSLVGWCTNTNPSTAVMSVPAYDPADPRLTLLDVGTIASVPVAPAIDWFIANVGSYAAAQ